jgi:hypothetical protein
MYNTGNITSCSPDIPVAYEQRSFSFVDSCFMNRHLRIIRQRRFDLRPISIPAREFQPGLLGARNQTFIRQAG